jgi:hypothetical protein
LPVAVSPFASSHCAVCLVAHHHIPTPHETGRCSALFGGDRLLSVLARPLPHLFQDRQHRSQVTALIKVARIKITTSANAASWTYPSGCQRERPPTQYSQGVNGQPLKNKNFVMGSTSSGGLFVLISSGTHPGIRRFGHRRTPPTATRAQIVSMWILIHFDQAAERPNAVVETR